jgi:WD40 repeat protein
VLHGPFSRHVENSLRFTAWRDKALSAVTFLTAAGRTLVAAAGSPPSIEIWDIETGDTAHSIQLGLETDDRTAALASYPHTGGAVLVAGSKGGGIRAWSVPGGRLQFNAAQAHIGEVRVCIGWSDGAEVLLTGGQDEALKVWSIADWQCIRTIPIGERIWSMAMAPTADGIVGTRRGLVSISPGAVVPTGSK